MSNYQLFSAYQHYCQVNINKQIRESCFFSVKLVFGNSVKSGTSYMQQASAFANIGIIDGKPCDGMHHYNKKHGHVSRYSLPLKLDFASYYRTYGCCSPQHNTRTNDLYSY